MPSRRLHSLRGCFLAVVAAVLAPVAYAQDFEGRTAHSQSEEVDSCSKERLQGEFKAWAESAATGFGVTKLEVLRRFVAGIDSVDLKLNDSDINLIWNPSRYTMIEGKIINEPELYAPIATQLAEDETSLDRLKEAAKDGDDWQITVRYHRERKKKKLVKQRDATGGVVRRADGQPQEKVAVPVVPTGRVAVSEGAKDGDLYNTVQRVLGHLVGAPSLKPEQTLCGQIDQVLDSVLSTGKFPKLAGEVRGLIGRKTLTKEDITKVATALPAAITNTPEFSFEGFYRGRSDLVGPRSEFGFKVRYVSPLSSARKYLDEPGSFLRFTRKALKDPEKINQRRRVAFLAEYTDSDDYTFDTEVVPLDPVVVDGGGKWMASLAYSAEVSGNALVGEAKEGNPNRRIRYEFQASYENFPNDPMRAEDRILAKALVTIPSFDLASSPVPLGDVSLGVVWASEPEFLTDLEFDSKLSAKVGLVFKLGEGKKKEKEED